MYLTCAPLRLAYTKKYLLLNEQLQQTGNFRAWFLEKAGFGRMDFELNVLNSATWRNDLRTCGI
jgi:hypothetical protein